MLKKTSIYLMHKYWGKKPSDELEQIISKFSQGLFFPPFTIFRLNLPTKISVYLMSILACHYTLNY